MKLKKLNYQIKGMDGITPLPNSNKDATSAIMIFRDICTSSLLSPMFDEAGRPEDFKVKMEKYDLYKLIQSTKGQEIEINIEQAKLLKTVIGYWQPPLIMGQCFEILEAKEPAAEK